MSKRKFHYGNIGTISCGTMRNEDLIPAFLNELEHLAKLNNNKCHLTLVNEIQNRIDTMEDYYDSEDADYDLNEDLFNALDGYAMPYCYFGSHPGDGADYGFWISDDAIRDDIKFNELLSISDLNEIPSDYNGMAIHINDHGNMTLYKCWPFGHRKEIWAGV